jgi:hypothetical protein
MYNNAELEIVRFAAEDVLATSTGNVTTEGETTLDPTDSIALPDDEF